MYDERSQSWDPHAKILFLKNEVVKTQINSYLHLTSISTKNKSMSSHCTKTHLDTINSMCWCALHEGRFQVLELPGIFTLF